MRRGLSILIAALISTAGFALPTTVSAGGTIGPWLPPEDQVEVGTTSPINGVSFINSSFNENLTVDAVSLGGADADAFSITADGCTGVTIAAFSGCSVSLSFTPTHLGLARAVVTFTDTGTVTGTETLSQSIYAVGGPIGELCGLAAYPISEAFADTYVGQVSGLGEFDRIRIANCGPVDLAVSAVTLSGDDAADFVLGPSTCVGVYAPFEPPFGNICYLDLAFQPQSPGAKEAIVTIESDGADTPQIVTLSGVGKPHADIGVTISAVTDPDPAERGGQATYTVTVTNHGPNTSEQAFVGFWFLYPGEFESVPPDAFCGPIYWGPGMSCILQLGDLAPGAISSFQAQVRIGTSGIPGELTGGALVGSNATADFGYDNNVMNVGSPIEDTEAPTVQFMNNQSPYTMEQWVDIQCVAQDNSAIDWDRSTCPWISGPAYAFNPGLQTYAATVFDLAGHRADASTTLEVIADYRSMRNLTSAWISKAGVLKSALSLLDSAAAADARGNAKAEAGKLAEYRGLLSAQSGKAITFENAQILIRFSYGL
jgi:hypothetical protein